MQEDSLVEDTQSTLVDILKSIRGIQCLRPQERRVVLREVVSSCDEEDIQVLRRLLGQTTRSGYDLVSALPTEISHKIFLLLEGMDLVRCCAVCWPWRRMIRGDGSLWKAKVITWNPAECLLLKDRHHQWNQHTASTLTLAHSQDDTTGQATKENKESMLDRMARQPEFIGWEASLVRELALKHNWRRGRYVYDMTVTLARNIKPTLLAWPFLFLVDDWPRLYKVSMDTVRQDGIRKIPMNDGRYTQAMDLQDHGTVSCMAWDSAPDCEAFVLDPESEGEVTEGSLPLAVGGYLRSVRVCDPDTKACIALPDVHHGFPLHVCFLQEQILSVTLDGQITFFQKGQEYRPIRSCTVTTKVLQVTPICFGEQSLQREHGGSIISWKEAICLGHEDGVIIKDEHSHTLCQIDLEIGCKLLQFQAIADDFTADGNEDVMMASYHRNELLILFEDPVTRQRRVLCVKMKAGYLAEISREMLTHSGGFSLGRGGDARDSIAMYRDRIAVVSHRNCSSDLGHYCVLRLMDVREDVMISTEYAEHVDEEFDLDEDDSDTGEVEKGEAEQVAVDSTNNQDRKVEWIPEKQIQQRGKRVHLNDFAGNKAAYRILAMDHARIVLGVGPRIVKILCLV
ncbi:MAG: hypothetical protein J3Q66DRAFT_344161 [Benniella sp.]|nr:MAG: hypothetical protein J3Q66DRAFT_344161 [Benniella sp.]